MKLVLAEKPSVGKELARVLGATKKQEGYFEGAGYLVTWSLGHLLTLKMPEDYHPEWAQWTFDTLPMMPESLGITPLRETRRQLNVVAKLAKRADVEAAIIGTDAGREGELVARYIFDYLKFEKPLLRLWISSQTDAAIRAGFEDLKPASAYENLYQAALARAEADWLVGLNVSRALTVKYQDSLAAGRVQTPTLAFVAQQARQRAAFVPQAYRQLSVTTPQGTAKLARRLSQAEADQLAEALADQALVVTAVAQQDVVETPPLPYDLNTLQQAASDQFDLSPKQTLNGLQQLYEREKLVTYPRTDSRYLTQDLAATMPRRLQAIGGYSKTAAQLARNAVATPGVYDDAKVRDHYGLIPTEEPVNLSHLSATELKLYRLIADRFIDLFKPDYRATVTTYTLAGAGETFTLTTTAVVAPGFKDVATSQAAPLAVGDTLAGTAAVAVRTTQAPPLLSESALLGRMDQHGLGTPATRADIIEKLQKSQLMQKVGRGLSVTAKGNQLLELVNPALVTPDLTAKWEAALAGIEAGTVTRATFIADIKATTTDLVQEIRRSDVAYRNPNLTQKRCPTCGSRLAEKATKNGVRLVCSNPTCSYSRAKDARLSNHRCGQCHKKMVVLQGAKGEYFKCQNCGNTEPIKKGAKRSSKREDAKLLKQYSGQDQDAGESPLALALKAAMNKQ
ncbi:DNA topoisomerase 3 [Lacticaseibacillus parakribbianus]|uniref:DNA topoisomerase 3 n=1 Tax=Lacticaseibacillus parakribbianus TaxID=2970927 RepID=UPI0021CB99B9|nr:DNA topoisomerase 3 [Lacticaseibacillus parakribbianus]